MMNNNYINNTVMNSNDMKNLESERYLLSELLKQLDRHPCDMSWEELIIENEDLSRQFTTYIKYQKSIGQPLIPQKIQKTMMCRNIIQGLQCPFGFNCRFAHNQAELTPKPKPTSLNHKAREFIPSSTGIISLESLPNILDTMDELNKQTIDIVLLEIKDCREKILLNTVVESMDVVDDTILKTAVETETTVLADVIETSDNKMDVEINEITEKLQESVKIEESKAVEIDILEKELSKQFDKTLSQVVKEKPIEDDGVCRGKVAKTGIRCTAPSKNNTLFCGRHKNYSGELMK